MATTSTSTKRARPTKTVQHQPRQIAPLIVDTTSMSILEGRLISTGGKRKAGGPLATSAELIYEPKKAGGTPSPYTVHVLSTKQHAVSATAARLRTVLEKTLTSFKETQDRHTGTLTEGEFIRAVAETLADKAPASAVSAEEGWQQLLERGLKSKTALLKSDQFKSTTQASELLGIGEPAVRKRIREHKLFALKASSDGDHRIPAWALDPGIAGAVTADLHANAPDVDEWQVYHYLSTPSGNLNGLRPFECLMSSANLPMSRRIARDELVFELELAAGESLLDVVRDELKADLDEAQPA